MAPHHSSTPLMRRRENPSSLKSANRRMTELASAASPGADPRRPPSPPPDWPDARARQGFPRRLGGFAALDPPRAFRPSVTPGRWALGWGLRASDHRLSTLGPSFRSRLHLTGEAAS